ncbi:MAG TPA: hypothetical protein VJA47_05635 [archaeon]|nr:hypothetical protein [archaeon]
MDRNHRGYTEDSKRFLGYLGSHRGAMYEVVVSGCAEGFGWSRGYTGSLISRLSRSGKIKLHVTLDGK